MPTLRHLFARVLPVFAALLLLCMLLPTQSVYAAGPLIKLSQKVLDSTSPIPSGKQVVIRLTYECSGSTGTGCSNVVMTTTLPAGLELRAHSEDSNVASFSYNAGTGVAVYTLVNLPLGTTGSYDIAVSFKSGTTKNGDTASVPSVITSSNATSQNPALIPLIASAADLATITKTTAYPAAVDSDTVYDITICSSPSNGQGALEVTGLSVVDDLPDGAVFLSANPAPTTATVVGAHTRLTWTAQPNVTVPGCSVYRVRVRFPDAIFNPGNTVGNAASMTYTPFGGTIATTKNTTVNHVIPVGVGAFKGSKTSNLDYAIVGEQIVNTLGAQNTGTGNLANVDLVDNIPDYYDVTAINTGDAIAVAYQKNNVNTWIIGVPLGTNVLVSSFPTFAGSDYVSALRFSTGDMPVGTGKGGYQIKSTVVSSPNSGAPTGSFPLLITNTLTGNATYNGSTVTMQSASSTVDIDLPYPRPQLTKSASTNGLAPDSDIVYTLKLNNRGFGPDKLQEPVLADLLPSQLSYVAGSWAISAPAGCTTPTFTTTPNYSGSGRTLLRWSWDGTGCALAAGAPGSGTPGESIQLTFTAHSLPNLVASTAVSNYVALIDYDNDPTAVKRIDCTNVTERPIYVAAGVDSAKFCSSEADNAIIVTSAQIKSAKYVKGLLDAGFSRDPLVGRTIRSGPLTFAIQLENTGNVDFKNISIVDLLPSYDPSLIPQSNVGTRDEANLGTTWTPRLAGPVEVTPAIPGLNILYSSEENPCRPDVVDDQLYCTIMTTSSVPGPGIWSENLPADISTVRSLWFRFPAGYVLPKAGSVRFEYDMYAPEDAPLATAGNDTIFGNKDDTNVAWNTFAYRVTRTDDDTDLVAQPPRVGIEVAADSGFASFGNYVWNDKDQDGTQNEGPERGINGVTVELYKADGTYVDRRVTDYDAGGNPGYYRFAGLDAGDYYAEFTLPNGYSFTISNVGGDDAIDSDGAVVVSPTVRRTATETLTVGENNLNYDQGLFALIVSLGDQVWFDTNNNSLIDAGEQGIDGVNVELFHDADGDSKLLGFEQFPIASTTTSNGGYYLFTQQTTFNGAVLSTPDALYPGSYIVGITKNNLLSGPLVGYQSSGTYLSSVGQVLEEIPVNPNIGGAVLNPGIDSDDNGRKIVVTPLNINPFYLGGILSAAVEVGVNEPLGEPSAGGLANEYPAGSAIPDGNSNQTVDFGFYTQQLGSEVFQDGGPAGDYDSGKREGGEGGVAGVVVKLYAADGATEIPVGPDGILGTADDGFGGVTTALDGSYSFKGLPDTNFGVVATGYVVKITTPGGFRSSTDLASASTPSNNLDEANDENGLGSGRGTISSSTGANALALNAGDVGAPFVDNAAGLTRNPTLDFGLVPLYALGNRIWLDTDDSGTVNGSEVGKDGVAVALYAADGTGAPTGAALATQTTSAGGYYLFDNLDRGEYVVVIAASNFSGGSALVGYTSSTGSTDDDDIDNNDSGRYGTGSFATTIVSSKIALGPGDAEVLGELATPGHSSTTPDARTNFTVDFGFYSLSVGNRIWRDLDNDGVYEINGRDGTGGTGDDETSISGVRVELYSGATLVASTITGGGGTYTFNRYTTGALTGHGLERGDYSVRIPASEFAVGKPLYGFTSSLGSLIGPDPDDNAPLDDNGSPVAGNVESSPVTLTPGAEAGKPTKTVTDSTGLTSDPTVDFGFYTMSLGNLVWYDLNNDGDKDTNETGIDGVTVRLFADTNADGAPDGAALASQLTSNGGHYLFTGLQDGGMYLVEIDTPTGYVSSNGQKDDLLAPTPYEPGIASTNNLADDNKDHGTAASATTIRSGTITLTAHAAPTGETDTMLPTGATNPASDANSQFTIDFGLITRHSIGNLVWVDLNNDGDYDSASELPVVDGVSVNLYWDENNNGALDGAETTPIRTAATASGLYLFDTLVPGNYLVELDATNFAAGGLLEGFTSSTGSPGNLVGPYEGAATPDPDTGGASAPDNDDNGTTQVGGSVQSRLVTLASGTEPVGENPDNDTTTLDGNENLTVDFGVFLPASIGDYIWRDADRNGAQGAGEQGVDGATVRLYDGITLLATTLTGDDPNTVGTQQGFYHFPNLEAGKTYIVRLNNPADFAPGGTLFGYVLTGPNLGNDSSDSDATLEGGFPRISAITGVAGTDTPTYDAGFYPTAALGDYVWLDADADGVQDVGETGIDGVTVRLYNGAALVATTTTGDDPNTPGIQQGFYRFDDLEPTTTYTIKLDTAADYTAGGPLFGYALSVQDSGGNDTADSDAEFNNGSAVITSAPTGTAGSYTPTYDIGFFSAASLGDYVWLDADADGVQDASELGIDGVTVRLFTTNGADGISGNADDALPVATAITGDDSATVGTEQGFYRFDGLRPNTVYTVKLDAASDYSSGPLAGLVLTTRDQTSTTDALDSDATLNSGIAQITSAPTSGPGSDILAYDIGFYAPAALGDYVWHDADGDGVQDGSESGIDGVTVRLYTTDGADGIAGNADDALPVATTLTGDDPNTAGTQQGFYQFTGLRPNTTYTVALDEPTDYAVGGPLAGYRLTAQDNGVDTLDSDAVLVGGFATITTAPSGAAGSNIATYDFGFVAPASLGDYVWVDVDRGGDQDAGEPGLDGVTVRLYAANGVTLITTTITGDDPNTAGLQQGYYHFANLLPNTSYVIKLDNPADYASGPLFGYLLTAQDMGVDDAVDSDAATVAGFAQITALTTGENTDVPTFDVGWYGTTALGDYVWFDADEDGVQDVSELGIDGVTVRLFTPNGADGVASTPDDALPVATTITGDDPFTVGVTEQGYYHFGSLRPGTTYTIVLDNPADYATGGPLAGFLLTTADATADTTDSDATLVSGLPTISTTTGGAGSDNPTNDIGFIKSYALGNRIWFDTNNNSQIDSGEQGVAGVTVRLYSDANNNGFDPADTLVAEQQTLLGGYYLFSALPAGKYVVVLPEANFTAGALQTYWSSGTRYDAAGLLNESTAALPNSDIDSDDNGEMVGMLGQSGGYVASGAITLGGAIADNEPISELDATVGIADVTPDARANTTLDFGFYTQRLGNLIWHDTDNSGTYSPNGADGLAGTADDETGIGSVSVELWPTDSTGTIVGGSALATTTTLADGTFSFTGLPQGDYVVRLAGVNFAAGGALELFRSSTGSYALLSGSFETAPSPNNSVDNDDNGTMLLTAGVIDMIDSRPISLTPGVGNAPGVTVSDATGATTNTTVDFGLYQVVSVGNLVFEDYNNNGRYDAGEKQMGGVAVQLFDNSGNEILVGADGVLGTADDGAGGILTALDGAYQFSNLTPGMYVVQVTSPTGYASSTGAIGSNTTVTGPYEAAPDPDTDIDSDDNGTVSGPVIVSAPVVVTSGGEPVTDGDNSTQSNLTIDFGLFQPASLGNIVWYDSNGDGLYNPGELGVVGVIVTLYDSNGTVIATTTTDTAGAWAFVNMPPGTYTVGFTNLPPNYIFTDPNQGDDGSDSDVDPVTGVIAPVTLVPGENNLTVYAGLVYQKPTGVALISFTARVEQAGVVVRWVTAAEFRSHGFNIYRNLNSDFAKAQLVTPVQILSKGSSGGGADYYWVDASATKGTTYTYWLEEVDINGQHEMFGPARLAQVSGAATRIFIPLAGR